eukprot:TRINITY_DN9563_c0_g1_i7.p1 TRINITY_DN9563_c0_g1~~TRINITY_DN9563_c0_g1_i7.p1  ORF type:complete len:403 (-),score=62.10 TRINITY_DN9563_c0_g1_i7:62-1270(-)
MFPLEFIITLCANITALLLAIVVVATVFTWRRRIHEPQWTFQSVLAQSTKSWVESQLCAPLAVTVRERMRGEYFRALRASMQPIVLSAACTPQSHPCFVLAERLKDGGGRNARWHPDFNGHDADISPELYDGTDELTQVAYEHRQGAIMWREHEAHYIVYAKDRVAIWTPPDVEWAPRGERERGIRIVGLVQFSAFAWPHPLCATQCDPRCDVWAGTVRIGGVCNALGVLQGPTYDRPALGSQKVIDPNQFVRGDNRWVPCEYRVGANGTPTLLGGERAHAQPELVDAVATPVLAAGLPLLAQLRRPGLLLQERTLQVVVKAQRTVVPPAHHENGESEDTGLWHADGQTEHVVAVILYCYHKDAALKGGEMEFADRSAMNVLGTSETVDLSLIHISEPTRPY